MFIFADRTTNWSGKLIVFINPSYPAMMPCCSVSLLRLKFRASTCSTARSPPFLRRTVSLLISAMGRKRCVAERSLFLRLRTVLLTPGEDPTGADGELRRAIGRWEGERRGRWRGRRGRGSADHSPESRPVSHQDSLRGGAWLRARAGARARDPLA